MSAPGRWSIGRIAAVVVGNALEFYDFLTYAFFAVQIGRTFFPSDTPDRSLLLSLATFGVGFVARPVGGVVIGLVADRAGRRPAMVLSFTLMGVAISGVALTPSYAAIGAAAPALVVLFRLIQGFALGGEVGPTTAYLLEIAPERRRGLFTSLQFATQGLAVTCAGVTGFVLSSLLDPAALEAWGWRLAFLLGAAVVPFGLIVRTRLEETLVSHRPATASSPSNGEKSFRGVIVIGFVLVAAMGITNYVLDYMTTFATQSLSMPSNVAFGATIVYGLCDLICDPISGWLSDRVGRKPVMLVPWMLLLVLAIPGFMVLTRLRSAAALLGVTAILGVLQCSGATPALIYLTEALPARVRSRGVGITYAMAIALFGGSTQFVVTWLIARTHNVMAPGWYMAAAMIAGLAAMSAARETAPVVVGTRRDATLAAV
jgi:MFS family permease